MTMSEWAYDEVEGERLTVLKRYNILDTAPEAAFDHLTALAASLLSAPIALISVVGEGRIWFKSHHGVELQQVARAPGLCDSAILQNQPLLITDIQADRCASGNPLVMGLPGLRFYLGVPLRTREGLNVGTLCVLDRIPRNVTTGQMIQLRELASIVVDHMESRLLICDSERTPVNAMGINKVADERSKLRRQELEHRVMNSLHRMSMLLQRQALESMNPESKQELLRAAGRVNAIGQIHHHIHGEVNGDGESIGTTGCSEYLDLLCSGLSALFAASNNKVSIACDSVDAVIATPKVVSMGLIVNELVTNAVEAGARRIDVTLEQLGAFVLTLSVTDDGHGLPKDFVPAVNHGLGMKVISSLVNHLGGDVRYSLRPDGGGTRVQVRFAVWPPGAVPPLTLVDRSTDRNGVGQRPTASHS